MLSQLVLTAALQVRRPGHREAEGLSLPHSAGEGQSSRSHRGQGTTKAASHRTVHGRARRESNRRRAQGWRSPGNGPCSENEQDFDIWEGEASLKWRRERPRSPGPAGVGRTAEGSPMAAWASPGRSAGLSAAAGRWISVGVGLVEVLMKESHGQGCPGSGLRGSGRRRDSGGAEVGRPHCEPWEGREGRGVGLGGCIYGTLGWGRMVCGPESRRPGRKKK